MSSFCYFRASSFIFSIMTWCFILIIFIKNGVNNFLNSMTYRKYSLISYISEPTTSYKLCNRSRLIENKVLGFNRVSISLDHTEQEELDLPEVRIKSTLWSTNTNTLHVTWHYFYQIKFYLHRELDTYQQVFTGSESSIDIFDPSKETSLLVFGILNHFDPTAPCKTLQILVDDFML